MKRSYRALRQYMKHHGMPADADDNAMLHTAKRKLATGEMTQEKFFDLTATKAEHVTAKAKPADPLQEKIDERHKMLYGEWPYSPLPAGATHDDLDIVETDHTATDEAVARIVQQLTTDDQDSEKGYTMSKQVTADSGDALMNEMVKHAGGNIRQIQPSEQLSTTKSVAKHARTGKPVADPLRKGQEIETPSELEYAKMGVYFKHLARRSGIGCKWSAFDTQLLNEVIHKDAWTGSYGGDAYERIVDPAMVKASLLDSSTSGGDELVPEWFDRNVVLFPLLSGELLPLVDIVNVPPSSGSSVEAASVGNPTLTWGHTEGSAFTEFDATGLVGEINTSLHAVVAGIEVGNDFMADAAVNVGQILSSLLFQRLSAELDKVIAIGDGSTQPLGITEASTVAVSSSGGTGTAPVAADIENLIFGIGKVYRQAGMRNSLMMNDTTYKRFRQVAISGTDDRRLFGMTHQDYMLLNEQVAIQNDLTNSQAAMGAFSKYRLYRRMGASARFTSEGSTLSLKNTSLLVFRARYGGRVMDSSAFAVMSDLQS